MHVGAAAVADCTSTRHFRISISAAPSSVAALPLGLAGLVSLGATATAVVPISVSLAIRQRKSGLLWLVRGRYLGQQEERRELEGQQPGRATGSPALTQLRRASFRRER